MASDSSGSSASSDSDEDSSSSQSSAAGASDAISGSGTGSETKAEDKKVQTSTPGTPFRQTRKKPNTPLSMHLAAAKSAIRVMAGFGPTGSFTPGGGGAYYAGNMSSNYPPASLDRDDEDTDTMSKPETDNKGGSK